MAVRTPQKVVGTGLIFSLPTGMINMLYFILTLETSDERALKLITILDLSGKTTLKAGLAGIIIYSLMTAGKE